MENKALHRANVVWTNFCRFALGIVFIFSGFVKADDPYGTVYKIEDYFSAFGWTDYVPSLAPLFLSCLMAVLEFTLGVYLFFGIRKKLTSIATALVMLLMTPFTLYLALANPVSDCGCFGDAIVLTNWETFWKNVLLLFFALWLYFNNSLILRFISKKSQWLISLYSILYSVSVVAYCIIYLPIFDFRPYYVGANIRQQMEIPEGEEPPVYETTFILEKDGVRKEFTLDNYPGRAADAVSIISAAGIGISYLYSFMLADKGILVFRTDNPEKTAEVIGRAGMKALNDEALLSLV